MCKSECRASLGGAHLDLRTWLRTVGTVRTKVRSVSNHKALYFTGFVAAGCAPAALIFHAVAIAIAEVCAPHTYIA